MVFKILLIIILIVIIITASKEVSNYNRLAFSKLMMFFILFFITVTLSVVVAENIEAFLTVYQNLLFGGIFLIISNNVLNSFEKIRKTVLILLISITIGIIFEFSIYIMPEFYQGFLRYIINSQTVRAIDFNLGRGRIYYESFAQTLIPIFFYFLIYKKIRSCSRVFLLLFLFLITLNAMVSNNRTFFLMAIFSLWGSILIFSQFFIKKFLIRSIILVIIFCVLINFILVINRQKFSFNIINRIILTDKLEDEGTMIARLELWKLAIEISFSSSILGVGLGNFLEHVPTRIQINYLTQSTLLRKTLPPAYENPHNIFFSFLAEAGILTASILFLMILYFFIKDFFFLINTRNYLLKSIIISFWSLFIFAFFNPINSIRFYTFFWLFRILIEKIGKGRLLSLKK